MSVREIEYKGVVGVPSIARAFGMSVHTLRYRLNQGLGIKEAIEKPLLGTVSKPPLEKKSYKIEGIKSPVELSNLWKLALGMEKYQ
ncbi:hypothetical protein VPCG_00045 [Vibrio phage martha 12B12]|uniref:hypothetical protein n=1 Tax=Vibrio phage martha 12B12 TaxID=573175 RepID=UPI0002C13981|nr:hypothetical protein VPCG_00045 [Vibrio phage martha 12B12]AGG58156.1 hypothetical protein VPCG_00045 [Vibrio phage martha 12B12]